MILIMTMVMEAMVTTEVAMLMTTMTTMEVMKMSSSTVVAMVHPAAAVEEAADPNDPLVLHCEGFVGDQRGVECGAVAWGAPEGGDLLEVLEAAECLHSSEEVEVRQQQQWEEDVAAHGEEDTDAAAEEEALQ